MIIVPLWQSGPGRLGEFRRIARRVPLRYRAVQTPVRIQVGSVEAGEVRAVHPPKKQIALLAVPALLEILPSAEGSLLRTVRHSAQSVEGKRSGMQELPRQPAVRESRSPQRGVGRAMPARRSAAGSRLPDPAQWLGASVESSLLIQRRQRPVYKLVQRWCSWNCFL